MTEVSTATDDDIARFYKGARIHGEWMGYSAKRGKLISAVGGLIRMDEHSWWGFMDIPAYMRTPIAFRYAKRLLQQAKDQGAEKVSVACDDTIPRAKEFLDRLGFSKTDEKQDEQRVYEWLA